MNITALNTIDSRVQKRTPPKVAVDPTFYVARDARGRLQGVATVERINQDDDRYINVTFDSKMSDETRMALSTEIKTDLDHLHRAYIFGTLAI